VCYFSYGEEARWTLSWGHSFFDEDFASLRKLVALVRSRPGGRARAEYDPADFQTRDDEREAVEQGVLPVVSL
jgi:hypothetical protein